MNARTYLGHDVLECGGLVGKWRSDKGGPSEGELFEWRKSDTSDDGDEGSVHHWVVDVLWWIKSEVSGSEKELENGIWKKFEGGMEGG